MIEAIAARTVRNCSNNMFERRRNAAQHACVAVMDSSTTSSDTLGRFDGKRVEEAC